VLDAGCGPGAYSEWLVQHGAHVTAVDASPKMVRLAQQRLGDTVDVRQADLGQPLPFPDAVFDLVISPLVLDYIEDWHHVFREFYRVLRTPGHVVFSVGHPFFDFVYFKSDNYFATERVGMEWKGFGTPVYVPTFRRPLQAAINPLIQAGFVLERILEPQPIQEFAEADPERYERLMREPNFMCVRARKG
jgi:SAM-dependent methyltransferase